MTTKFYRCLLLFLSHFIVSLILFAYSNQLFIYGSRIWLCVFYWSHVLTTFAIYIHTIQCFNARPKKKTTIFELWICFRIIHIFDEAHRSIRFLWLVHLEALFCNFCKVAFAYRKFLFNIIEFIWKIKTTQQNWICRQVLSASKGFRMKLVLCLITATGSDEY